jgi:hypothetical protein
VLPVTQFIEGNRSCRDCIKKYNAQRWKVLKACRD